MLSTLLFAVVGFYLLRKIKQRNLKTFAIIFALLFFIKTLVFYFLGLKIAQVNWYENLPLHLCDISAFLCCAVLINKSQKIFEYLLFYGSIAAFNAVMTPMFIHGTHIIFKIDYVFQHSLILIIPFYLFFIHKMKITKYSILRASIIILFIIELPIHLFNLIFKTNYIYTIKPPFEDHPLIIGDWPTYFIVFIAFGLGVALLLQLIIKKYFPFGYKTLSDDKTQQQIKS